MIYVCFDFAAWFGEAASLLKRLGYLTLLPALTKMDASILRVVTQNTFETSSLLPNSPLQSIPPIHQRVYCAGRPILICYQAIKCFDFTARLQKTTVSENTSAVDFWQVQHSTSEHRFLECSGTQGSNSSGARGGREHITPELRVEPWVRTCRTQVQPGV